MVHCIAEAHRIDSQENPSIELLRSYDTFVRCIDKLIRGSLTNAYAPSRRAVTQAIRKRVVLQLRAEATQRTIAHALESVPRSTVESLLMRLNSFVSEYRMPGTTLTPKVERDALQIVNDLLLLCLVDHSDEGLCYALLNLCPLLGCGLDPY